MLGVSSSTLRNWASLFADALSPTAAKPPQLPNGNLGARLYHDTDIVVLSKASEMLRRGMSYEAIAAALTGKELPQPEPAQPADGKPPQPLPAPSPVSHTVMIQPLGELGGVLQAIADQKTQLERIEARLADMERRIATEYALVTHHLILTQSRRTGRWSRYLVWRASGLIYQFYLGPASEHDVKQWQEHVLGLYLEEHA